MRAKALLVKRALDSLFIRHVTERTLGHLTLHAPAALGHLGHVVLMQELTVVALHAERAQPMATYDCAAFEIFLHASAGAAGATDARTTRALAHVLVVVVRQQRLEVEDQAPLLLIAQQQPQHHLGLGPLGLLATDPGQTDTGPSITMHTCNNRYFENVERCIR